MKLRTEKLVNVGEWDKLVTKTYKRPYSFQQQDGCMNRGIFPLTVPAEAEDYKNYTIPEIVNGEKMGVSFAAWLARDPKASICGEKEDKSLDYVIELFWHRNFYPDIEMVANDLHKKGLLEAGKYLINIDW